MSARRRSRSARGLVAAELDLMPLMNLFIAIIPLLLLSAVFVQVTVIKMGAAGDPDAAAVAREAPLDLTVRVVADAYVVESRGRVLDRITRTEPVAAREALQAALAALAAEHPEHREVRVVAAPTTTYEEIVDVMDVARAAGLPDAALDDEAS